MKHPKSRAPTAISSVLTGVLRKVQKGGKLSLEEMMGVWERVAGREAAEHSWPRRMSGGRVVVEVENSGWMYALGLKRAQLVEGLMELLGAARAKTLSLRIGERKDA